MLDQGCVIWITGLSGSGKTTLAKQVYAKIKQRYQHAVYLDGDGLRDILGDYGYSKQERIALALKRAKLANFLAQEGLIVIVSTISLFAEVYAYNQKHITSYYEIYVECDFSELQRRDQKQLYTRALKGEICNVVGIDIAYDAPKSHLKLINQTPQDIQDNVKKICDFLKL